MRNWLDTKLVPQWRMWWKLYSVQIGLLVSAAITAFMADPAQLVIWINQLPPSIRNSLPYWTGPLVAIIIFLARFWDQHKSLLDPAKLAADPAGTAADVIAGVKGLEAAAKTNPLASPPTYQQATDPAVEASKSLPGQGS